MRFFHLFFLRRRYVLIFCVILAIAEAKDWERSSASRESGPHAGRLQADHLGSESAGQDQIDADQKHLDCPAPAHIHPKFSRPLLTSTMSRLSLYRFY